MARSTAYRNAASDAVGTDVTTWVALHTADPAGGDTAELDGGGYARGQITFPVSAAGETSDDVTINVPAGVTVTHWSRQTASTGANNYEDDALDPEAVFNSAGTLTLTLTINTPA